MLAAAGGLERAFDQRPVGAGTRRAFALHLFPAAALAGPEDGVDDLDGSLSLHVSIRGLDGRAYSERYRRGGPRTVANIYGGKFGALRHAWGRIKGVLFAAARTVVAPVHGLFSVFGF